LMDAGFVDTFRLFTQGNGHYANAEPAISGGESTISWFRRGCVRRSRARASILRYWVAISQRHARVILDPAGNTLLTFPQRSAYLWKRPSKMELGGRQ
jgi:hypothetical protein